MTDRHHELPAALLQQLLDLIDRLHAETSDFVAEPGDQQLWYNRGYANGMLKALVELGRQDSLAGRQPDDPQALAAQWVMPWGKAYLHGESTGSRETYEITGSRHT